MGFAQQPRHFPPIYGAFGHAQGAHDAHCMRKLHIFWTITEIHT